MRIIVTGGAGFIGSAVIRHLINNTEHQVLNIDKLTYAGNLATLTSVSESTRYEFLKADICDTEAMHAAFASFQPNAIMHLAAESHVDRSIDGPMVFLQTNIMGTATLLEVARQYWLQLTAQDQAAFRFHHVSTDEVYGSLGASGLFTEETPYDPRSPYSSSKAGSDHLVRAWMNTYGLPVVVSNCSNNYGPYQFPEKLIPLVILNALNERPLPIYGDGQQIRDWLYVEDHARALLQVMTEAAAGETYNIGGHNEKTNLEVVQTICAHLDSARPRTSGNYADLITYVDDRPGHDRRYAIDASKIAKDLGWTPEESFDTGIAKTVDWYLNNPDWSSEVQQDNYQGQRLGLASKE